MKVTKKGRSEAGVNVTTIDLGEKIDGAIRAEAARLAGPKRGGGSRRPGSKFSRFAGQYRPVMHGGYRPWYSGRGAASGEWKLGAILGLSQEMKKVGSGLLTGSIAGAAGNRVVVWGVANATGVRSKLLAEAIGFGAGLLPLLAARNALTFGLAIPGTVQLVGALTEEILGYSGIPFLQNPGLSGGVGRRVGHMGSRHGAEVARQKLADVKARINKARQSAAQLPRVVARPRQAVA